MDENQPGIEEEEPIRSGTGMKAVEAPEEETLPVLNVWVNAGFGRGSYLCRINEDSTMTLPDALVRELNLQIGDDLDWEFDEQEGVLYVRVVEKTWEPPDWLKD